MHCQNCDRKFRLDDGQFCPYCATPLYLPIKPKKKKKRGDSTGGDIDNDWNFTMAGLALLIGMFIVAYYIFFTLIGR